MRVKLLERVVGLLLLSAGLQCPSLGAKEAVEQVPVQALDGACVRDWLVLGPCESQDLDANLLAEPAEDAWVRPVEGATVRTRHGQVLTWTRFRSDSDFVKLERAFGERP